MDTHFPRFWTETCLIDNSQVQQYCSFRRKRAFILPSAASGRNQMPYETSSPNAKKSRRKNLRFSETTFRKAAPVGAVDIENILSVLFL